jgi:hypothetical protein
MKSPLKLTVFLSVCICVLGTFNALYTTKVAAQTTIDLPSAPVKLYRAWCPRTFQYGGCSSSGNGPSCTTEKSC